MRWHHGHSEVSSIEQGKERDRNRRPEIKGIHHGTVSEHGEVQEQSQTKPRTLVKELSRDLIVSYYPNTNAQHNI